MSQHLDRTRHAISRVSRRVTVLMAVGTAVSVASCASPPAPVPQPVPADELPLLLQDLRDDPGNRDLQGRAAASLLRAGRCNEASEIGRDAVSTPSDSWPTLVEGECLEEGGRDAEALELYQDYLDLYDEGGGAGPVRGRALLVERRLTQAEALEAVRNPASTPGPATTVAVVPFRVRGDDDLEPMGRSLAERLSADLAEIDGLEVVDPLRVRFVLDRFEAPGAFGLDAAQAAELGRILGAGQVVQGTAYLDDSALNRLATRITRADGSEGQGGRVEGALGDVPRLEKELALATARALGQDPSLEERTRILYRGPRDLPSLRAYGEGLDLLTQGRYGDAAGRFGATVRLDPEFADARRALQASAGAAVLDDRPEDNVLALTPAVSEAIDQALRPTRPVDPLRLAIRAGTSDVSATQGERITGVTAATGEDGAVGSIQNLDAPALLTPAQLTGLIRILVVIPGG